MSQTIAQVQGPNLGFTVEPLDALVTNNSGSTVNLGEVMAIRPTAIGVFDTIETPVSGDVTKGFFCVALETIAASAVGKVRVRGICTAYTKNSAGAGGAAIVNGNLYGVTTAKDFDSDTATYGLSAKLVARAIGTGTATATNTRALRTVIVDGISGFGGIYGGTG